MPDDPTVPPRSPCPTATDAERLLATLAAVFDDEAGYGPRLTVAAAGALNLLAGYLSTALGPAQAAAAPSPNQLAEILLALHIAALSLHKCCAALKMPTSAAFTMPTMIPANRTAWSARCRASSARCRVHPGVRLAKPGSAVPIPMCGHARAANRTLASAGRERCQ